MKKILLNSCFISTITKQPIPFPLTFEGIIVAQGVKAQYGGEAYTPSVEI